MPNGHTRRCFGYPAHALMDASRAPSVVAALQRRIQLRGRQHRVEMMRSALGRPVAQCPADRVAAVGDIGVLLVTARNRR